MTLRLRHPYKDRVARLRKFASRLHLSWLLALGLSWSGTSEAGGDEILVVVNEKNPTARLGAEELRPIFLTNRVAWGSGERIDPVNLPNTHAARRRFDQVVLGMDEDEVQRYWIDRKVRGGARPPRKVPSVDTVLAHVAATPGAVGYVPSGESIKGVKVVARVGRTQVLPP